ncbi:hypothetical protein CCH79_00020169, partial [Gambusia affinis]
MNKTRFWSGSSLALSSQIKMSPGATVLTLIGLIEACVTVGEPASLCQIRGSPEFPVLSKEGDVMIGGAFSIHSKITQPSLSFTERPTAYKCSSINQREFRFAQICQECFECLEQDLMELSGNDDDVEELRYSSNIYKAVYAISHSLHSILKCSEIQGCKKTVEIKPWEVVEALKNVNFTVKNGDRVWFDQTGAAVARYEVVNWQRGTDGLVQFRPVGYYDASLPSGQRFILNTDAIMWPGGTKELPVSVCSESCRPGTHKVLQKGKPVCCFDCVPCPVGEFSNTPDSIDCKKCPEAYWSNQNRDACLPKEIEFLSFTE